MLHVVEWCFDQSFSYVVSLIFVHTYSPQSAALHEKRKRKDDESDGGVRVEAAKKIAIDREKVRESLTPTLVPEKNA